MKVLNIHAGTTDKDIIEFIKTIIPLAENLEEEEKKIKEEKMKMGFLYDEKKIWIFLDEINTCKSMGLISELMCKKSYQGKKLPNNIIFIAACNPYREAKKKKEGEIGLDINQAHKQMENLNEKEKKEIEKSFLLKDNKLVYTVNPLPHSLLNFVFDFGSINKDDELLYIENMIQEPIEKSFEINKNNSKKDQLKEIKNLAKNMISESQNFIRDNNDISSVSLREIRKFIEFYKFFNKYLKYKKNNLINLIENDIKQTKMKFEYDK